MIVCNLAADLLYARLDPRVRTRMSVVTPHDPVEVARRIHGEGSGVGQRGKRAFVALTRTAAGRSASPCSPCS